MSQSYIVSARKYRPDTFASIVGQGAMSTTLKAAVLGGRMAHAYLFCGPRGVGKTTAARVLAKTINCQNLGEDGEACNACESCVAFNEQRSFNIFELDAASNNSVEDIRSLTEQVMIAPVLGRYKVYIIDEVHMLSQAAFNAFLKTLEEPPSYAVFILATTEKHKILPTILSRCQTYDFKRITVMDITHHLRYVADSEGINADDAALGLIAEKADGGMRDALSMFDRVASYGQGEITYEQALDCLNILDYSYYLRFVQAFVTGDYRSLLLTLDEVLGRGFDGQLVMSGLASFARDLLVVQHASTISLLEKPETVQTLYLEAARMVAPQALHQLIRMLVQADNQYRGATNKRLLIEVTFLNILSAFQPHALEVAAAQPSEQLTPRTVSVTLPTAQTAAASSSTAIRPPSPRQGAEATTLGESHSANLQSGGTSVSPASGPNSASDGVNVAPASSPNSASEGVSVAPASSPNSASEGVNVSPASSPNSASEGVNASPAIDNKATPLGSEPSSTSTSAVSVQAIPSNRLDGLQTRQRFRNRRSNTERVEDKPIVLEEQHEAYEQADVQQAWLRYVEERISNEQVYLKNILGNVLPTISEQDRVQLPLMDTATIISPVQEMINDIQLYLQQSVRNTDLRVHIQPVAPETVYQPTTNREKCEALERDYPMLTQFRQHLKLRVL